MKALSIFHPIVQQWFTHRLGAPTDIQTKSWPGIAEGAHMLIIAPTGSGKTLAAFLWALNQLITGDLPAGCTSVLYISPLKALNNDIQRNLISPLRELEQLFGESQVPFPRINALVRSGDTRYEERRRMLRQPPEILITTPESLNIMLSSKSGRTILGNLKVAILDEIHNLFGSRRGTYLITAVDRLVRLSGEFQRIALSATIKPEELVARFIAGYRMTEIQGQYEQRDVSIVRSNLKKEYELSIYYPDQRDEYEEEEDFWIPLVRELCEIIGRNRSTLIFTNSRRLAERITLKINALTGEQTAYAHHGSLSREVRERVEQKLKSGDLRAIVATSSLELGIDIGALDEVILIQSPPTISSSIQRIGRAGHNVGEISRGALFPTHPHDFLSAAVLAREILSGDIEPMKPVSSPLDVLAQIIVAMTAAETWDIDELYLNIKASYPYHNLDRDLFDRIIAMLAGRYADCRIRELRPLVSHDRMDNTLFARRGALQIVCMRGGVIPDRGYFQLRHSETNARIGELDEEFVWENPEGSIFTLGTQSWKVERVTPNDVFVSQSRRAAPIPPFWKGEHGGRDFHFSEKIGIFLEEANDNLDKPDFLSRLQQDYRMDAHSSTRLVEFLKNQRDFTGCALPHRHHLLVECVRSGPQKTPVNQVILHTIWGARVNRPFALALRQAWTERYGYAPEVYPTDDTIVIISTSENSDEILKLVKGSTLPSLLRKQLEGSGFFGARFRECAGRALLLTPTRLSQRMPLWLSRIRSQVLLDAVKRYEDFPILLETWRSCLQDEFDMENLEMLLIELESGSISWSEAHTGSASPFAKTTAHEQINKYMYMDDQPADRSPSQLRESLIREVVFSPALRPRLPRELAEQFEKKRQRLHPGYSPQTSGELLEWVEERRAIPLPEWRELQDAMKRDHGIDPESLIAHLEGKIVMIHPAWATRRVTPTLVAACDAQNRLNLQDIPGTGFDEKIAGLSAFLGDWLQFYGPRKREWLKETLGIEEELLQNAIGHLIESGTIIQGDLLKEGNESGTGDEFLPGDKSSPGERLYICDSRNFETLLRMHRSAQTPVFEPLDAERLQLFLAQYQGLTNQQGNINRVLESIVQLEGYQAQAAMWEAEILPARVPGYMTSWLDSAMLEGELQWIGCENRQVMFCLESDRDLLHENMAQIETTATRGESHDLIDGIFPDAERRYDFLSLQRLTQVDAVSLTSHLWNAVWEGKITNDTVMSLRKGIMNDFESQALSVEPGRSRSGRHHHSGRGFSRRGFQRWKGALPISGNWHRLPEIEPVEDPLELEEMGKERVRLLLDRYGILFREVLDREIPACRWSSVFRSLRLMELSGEVLSGCLFKGIPGPQFISFQAFQMLQQTLYKDRVYFMSAADPASLCGIQLEALRGKLPRRLATTHIVYRGSSVMMISERLGKTIIINTPHIDPSIRSYLCVFRHLLAREFQPLPRVVIERINDERAAESPYLSAFRDDFEVEADYTRVILYRKRNER